MFKCLVLLTLNMYEQFIYTYAVHNELHKYIWTRLYFVKPLYIFYLELAKKTKLPTQKIFKSKKFFPDAWVRELGDLSGQKRNFFYK